jgi:prepilin-type N-terminal cleavage/methylation domain-containing protein
MRRQTQYGYSLVELTITLAIAGLVLATSSFAWSTYLRKTQLSTMAQTTTMVLHRARLQSIFQGVNHFVVLDPNERLLQIYKDTSAPIGSFDAGDTLVSLDQWPASVRMELPTGVVVSNPIGSGNLSSAWSLPLPDTSGRWGADLRGVMMTPSGRVMSAEATPQIVGLGTIVFKDNSEQAGAVSVSIEGRSGVVRAFRLQESAWKQL